MRKHLLLGIAGLGTALLFQSQAFAGDAPASGACMSVAMAKYAQWQQARLKIDTTKIFPKGNQYTDVLIATENMAYVEHRGNWATGNIAWGERVGVSPAIMLANMGLAECKDEGVDNLSGQPAKIVSFTYVADNNGFVAHGKIWISPSTGLPLREDLHEGAPPANRLVATDISAIYVYNGDVVIPGHAELAEATRLQDGQAAFRFGVGPGSGLH